MTSKVYPSKDSPIPVPDLYNWNTDRSVETPVMVRGMMYRTSGGWHHWDGSITATTSPLSADGSSVSAVQGDAGLLRVSSIGSSFTSSPLSADSSSVSAVQADAGLLHVSAIGLSNVTRVSSDILGGSIDNTSFGATQTAANALRVSSFSDDAGLMRISAVGMSSVTRVSADLLGGSIDNTAFGATQSGTWTVSAVPSEGTSFIGNVSAKNTDATNFRVSSFSGDAGLMRVSAVGATTTATLSNVSSSASNVTLLASNANRRGASIHNDSTATLYLKLGATASTSSFTVKMLADEHYEVPFGYTGIIDGIWASANGAARVTEITA